MTGETFCPGSTTKNDRRFFVRGVTEPENAKFGLRGIHQPHPPQKLAGLQSRPPDDPNLKVAVNTWAMDVSEALAPQKLPVFARSRWVTSARIAAEVFLLTACHNLFSRVVRRWLGTSYLQTSWKVTDEPPAKQVAAPLADGNDQISLWSEFNERQRLDAGRLAQNPIVSGGVALWHTCLGPMVRMVDRMLLVAGREWDFHQQLNTALHGRRSLRVLEACSGRLTTAFSQKP